MSENYDSDGSEAYQHEQGEFLANDFVRERPKRSSRVQKSTNYVSDFESEFETSDEDEAKDQKEDKRSYKESLWIVDEVLGMKLVSEEELKFLQKDIVESKDPEDESDPLNQAPSSPTQNANEQSTQNESKLADEPSSPMLTSGVPSFKGERNIEAVYIKWKGLSYLHCTWEDKQEIYKYDNLFDRKLKKFQDKYFLEHGKTPLEVDPDDFDDEALVDPSYTDVQRVISCDRTNIPHMKPSTFEEFERLVSQLSPLEEEEGEGEGNGDDGKQATKPHNDHEYDEVWYLVKWRGLPYSDSSWEFWRNLRGVASREVFDFWQRETLPPEEMSKKWKHPAMLGIPYSPLEESPIFGENSVLYPSTQRQLNADTSSSSSSSSSSSDVTESKEGGQEEGKAMQEEEQEEVQQEQQAEQQQVPANDTNQTTEGASMQEEGKEEEEEENKKEDKDKSLELRLRDYQLRGVNWLLKNWWEGRNSILADEMGLGKTIQTLSFFHVLWQSPLCNLPGPFLVVGPLSLIHQWASELELWSPEFNVIIYHGNAASRELIQLHELHYRFPYVTQDQERKLRKASQIKPHIILTTYQIFSKDAHIFSSIKWAVLAVDEAHRLKNEKGQLFKTMLKVKRDHTVLLTGTPIQNNLEELWPLLHTVDKKRFRHKEDFMRSYGEVRKSSQVSALHRETADFILRRVKEDVEKSLPPKQETIIEVSLTSLQKQFYRAIYEKNTGFLLKGAKSSNLPSLMNIVMELRKCCNHPFLCRGGEDRVLGRDLHQALMDPVHRHQSIEKMILASGKMVLLDKMLTKLKKDGGHKILVFSQMVKVLDLIEHMLVQRGFLYERLDGSSLASDRKLAVHRFNTPSFNRFVMLLSTRAGGLGLNLATADTVIIYDSDWNPHNDIQAQARAHRIGQNKAVMVYRLLTRKTYEMQMFQRASIKLGLDKAMLAHQRGDGDESKENGNEDGDDNDALIPSSSTKTKRRRGKPKKGHEFDSATTNKTINGVTVNAGEIDELLRRGAYDILNQVDMAIPDSKDLTKSMHTQSTPSFFRPSSDTTTSASSSSSNEETTDMSVELAPEMDAMIDSHLDEIFKQSLYHKHTDQEGENKEGANGTSSSSSSSSGQEGGEKSGQFKASQMGNVTFASFAGVGDEAGTTKNVDLYDPDFWTKTIGLERPPDEMELLLQNMPTQRVRRQTVRAKQFLGEEAFDDLTSDSEEFEDDDDDEEVKFIIPKKKKVRTDGKLEDRSMMKGPSRFRDHIKTISGEWLPGSRDRFIASIQIYGFGRWRRLQKEANVASRPIADIDEFGRWVVLAVALQLANDPTLRKKKDGVGEFINLMLENAHVFEDTLQLIQTPIQAHTSASFNSSSGGQQKKSSNDDDDDDDDDGTGGRKKNSFNELARKYHMPPILQDPKFTERMGKGGTGRHFLNRIENLKRMERLIMVGCERYVHSLPMTSPILQRWLNNPPSTADEALIQLDMLEVMPFIPVGNIRPKWGRLTTWWNIECDQQLLMGAFLYGYGRWGDMRSDPRLLFFWRETVYENMTLSDMEAESARLVELLGSSTDKHTSNDWYTGTTTTSSRSQNGKMNMDNDDNDDGDNDDDDDAASVTSKSSSKQVGDIKEGPWGLEHLLPSPSFTRVTFTVADDKTVAVWIPKYTYSKYRGVFSQPGSIRWASVVYRKSDGMQVFLGSFKTQEEASQVVEKALAENDGQTYELPAAQLQARMELEAQDEESEAKKNDLSVEHKPFYSKAIHHPQVCDPHMNRFASMQGCAFSANLPYVRPSHFPHVRSCGDKWVAHILPEKEDMDGETKVAADDSGDEDYVDEMEFGASRRAKRRNPFIINPSKTFDFGSYSTIFNHGIVLGMYDTELEAALACQQHLGHLAYELDIEDELMRLRMGTDVIVEVDGRIMKQVGEKTNNNKVNRRTGEAINQDESDEKDKKKSSFDDDDDDDEEEDDEKAASKAMEEDDLTASMQIDDDDDDDDTKTSGKAKKGRASVSTSSITHKLPDVRDTNKLFNWILGSTSSTEITEDGSTLYSTKGHRKRKTWRGNKRKRRRKSKKGGKENEDDDEDEDEDENQGPFFNEQMEERHSVVTATHSFLYFPNIPLPSTTNRSWINDADFKLASSRCIKTAKQAKFTSLPTQEEEEHAMQEQDIMLSCPPLLSTYDIYCVEQAVKEGCFDERLLLPREVSKRYNLNSKDQDGMYTETGEKLWDQFEISRLIVALAIYGIPFPSSIVAEGEKLLSWSDIIRFAHLEGRREEEVIAYYATILLPLFYSLITSEPHATHPLAKTYFPQLDHMFHQPPLASTLSKKRLTEILSGAGPEPEFLPHPLAAQHTPSARGTALVIVLRLKQLRFLRELMRLHDHSMAKVAERKQEEEAEAKKRKEEKKKRDEERKKARLEEKKRKEEEKKRKEEEGSENKAMQEEDGDENDHDDDEDENTTSSFSSSSSATNTTNTQQQLSMTTPSKADAKQQKEGKEEEEEEEEKKKKTPARRKRRPELEGASIRKHFIERGGIIEWGYKNLDPQASLLTHSLPHLPFWWQPAAHDLCLMRSVLRFGFHGVCRIFEVFDRTRSTPTWESHMRKVLVDTWDSIHYIAPGFTEDVRLAMAGTGSSSGVVLDHEKEQWVSEMMSLMMKEYQRTYDATAAAASSSSSSSKGNKNSTTMTREERMRMREETGDQEGSSLEEKKKEDEDDEDEEEEDEDEIISTQLSPLRLSFLYRVSELAFSGMECLNLEQNPCALWLPPVIPLPNLPDQLDSVDKWLDMTVLGGRFWAEKTAGLIFSGAMFSIQKKFLADHSTK